jgi:hypothetical protein
MGKPFDFESRISRDLYDGHDEGNDKKGIHMVLLVGFTIVCYCLWIYFIGVPNSKWLAGWYFFDESPEWFKIFVWNGDMVDD